MRAAVVALTWLAGCASAPLSTPEVLHIKSEVLDFLASVQREFKVETVLCLRGVDTGRVVRIHDVQLAGVTHSTPTSAHFDTCQRPGSVGVAHNHPRGTCAFSTVDRENFERHGYRVALVSCDGGFAWMTRDDSGRFPWRSP